MTNEMLTAMVRLGIITRQARRKALKEIKQEGIRSTAKALLNYSVPQLEECGVPLTAPQIRKLQALAKDTSQGGGDRG